ncbi:MAG: hypothetical protein AB9856_09240 [Cellulosilyticaceae bacterium]
MFSADHIRFMTIEIIIIGIICFYVKSVEHRKIDKFLKISTVFILMFDPIYWVWELNNFGFFRWENTLPLYLCSLFWILMPFVAFTKKGSKLNRITTSCLCTICLLAGILGTVFNIYMDTYPFLSFVVIRSLLYHFCMILIPSILWCTGYYKPHIQDTFQCFIPVIALLVPCFVVDKKFGWDYCYLNGGIGTPLESLSKLVPNLFFIIILYGGLFITLNVIFYIPIIKQHSNVLKNKLMTLDLNK